VQSNLCTETFNKKDVDFEVVLKKAMDEFALFKDNDNGRSKEKHFKDTIMGHRVEQWLIDKCGFINNPKEFQDIFKPDGVSRVEVKCTAMGDLENDTDGIIKGINGHLYGTPKRYGITTRRYKFKHDVADNVYLFHYNKLTGDYILVATAKANDLEGKYVLDDEIVL